MKTLFLSVFIFCVLNSHAQIEGISNSASFDIKTKKDQRDTIPRHLTGISKIIYFNISAGSNSEKNSKKRDSIAPTNYEGISGYTNFNIVAPELNKITEPEQPLKTDNAEGNPRYFAVIIGVNDYLYNSEELRDLSNPIKDASSLKNLLIENYSFNSKNILFLENPKRSDILDVLDQLAYTINEKDNLLIFYAGHGKWDEQIKVGYWLPADSKIDSKSNWISNSTLTDYISGIKSKHTLLISDACFSGSIFKSRGISEGLNELGFARIYKMPSRKAMTSGSLNVVPDKSIFMYYLLKRLNSLDDDFITSKQLFYQIETAVINNSNNIPQFGIIQNAGDEGGDFIFIRKK